MDSAILMAKASFLPLELNTKFIPITKPNLFIHGWIIRARTLKRPNVSKLSFHISNNGKKQAREGKSPIIHIHAETTNCC